MRIRSVRLGFFLALMFAAPSFADEKIALKQALEPGISWSFDQTQDSTSDNKAMMNGQTQAFTTKMHGRRVGKIEVLAVKEGQPTSLRITFEDGCETTSEMGGQQQSMPFPYAGKTVTVTRGDDGSVTDDFQGQADPASVGQLHGALDQEAAVFPKAPVAVGEEWSGDPAAISKMLQLSDPKDRAGMTLKLLSVKDVAGRPTAEVKVSLAAETTQQGISGKMISQGTALIDIATGHTISTDMKGTTSAAGDQSGPGPNGAQMTYHVDGNGTITTAMTSQFISAGSAPAANPMAAATPAATGNPLAPAAPADPFSGTFSDGKLTVEMSPSNGGYTGTLTLGNQKFPATATAKGNSLSGSFKSGGNDFTFTAIGEADTLNFVTAGTTYNLKKAAVNPLANPAPANPLAPGASNTKPGEPASAGGASTNSLASYKQINRTDFGAAFSTEKPNAKSVQAALVSAFHDLATTFDSKPIIGSAFEDQTDHTTGRAAFTAKLKGQPVAGFVSCKLGPKGAVVAVIYCRADAPAAEWNKLTASSGAPGTAATADGKPQDVIAASQQVPLQPYQFPDGTGSIGVADGWQTNAQTLASATIQGPGDQTIIMCANLSVTLPNSQLAQLAARTGGLIAPYAPPDKALEMLAPQLSAIAQRNGKPAFKVDHVVAVKQMKPALPNGNAAILNFGVTKLINGEQKHYRVIALAEVDPVPPGGWMIGLTQAAAPDATYEKDLPTMLAMTNSLRTNDQVITQKSQQHLAAQNQWFAAQQKAHAEVEAANDQQHADYYRRSNEQSRGVDDFDEVLRGYRTVQDTQTGEKTSVDLGNVDDVVNNLNRYEPDRYKQIPLRDEADPIPGR